MIKTIGAIFVCWWAADFLTGFFHWLEDTYCLEQMPLIGGFICEPNIDHHIDPQLMVRVGTFFSRNVFQWVLCGVLFWRSVVSEFRQRLHFFDTVFCFIRKRSASLEPYGQNWARGHVY